MAIEARELDQAPFSSDSSASTRYNKLAHHHSLELVETNWTATDRIVCTLTLPLHFVTPTNFVGVTFALHCEVTCCNTCACTRGSSLSRAITATTVRLARVH
jgi:hypothetical protein